MQIIRFFVFLCNTLHKNTEIAFVIDVHADVIDCPISLLHSVIPALNAGICCLAIPFKKTAVSSTTVTLRQCCGARKTLCILLISFVEASIGYF